MINKKKLTRIFVLGTLLLSTAVTNIIPASLTAHIAYAADQGISKTATLNNAKVSFNGQEPVTVQAYLIDGYNYIRARDITNGLDMKVEPLGDGAVGIRIFPDMPAESNSRLEALTVHTIHVPVETGELAYLNKRNPGQCFHYADRHYFKVDDI